MLYQEHWDFHHSGLHRYPSSVEAEESMPRCSEVLAVSSKSGLDIPTFHESLEISKLSMPKPQLMLILENFTTRIATLCKHQNLYFRDI